MHFAPATTRWQIPTDTLSHRDLSKTQQLVLFYRDHKRETVTTFKLTEL